MKRRCLVQALLLVTSAVGARTAFAQTVCSGSPETNQVCINPSPAANDFATGLGTTPEQVAADILNQVNNLFQVTNVGSFLRDFQDAQAFSSKGLGVDYASEATLAEVGATFSLASNVDKAYKPSGSYTETTVRGSPSGSKLPDPLRITS